MSRRVQGRGAYPGVATARALVANDRLGGWDAIDTSTGAIKERGHPLEGQTVSGRVLVIAGARGSTGWATQFLRLRLLGIGPAAMVFPSIDSRTAAACVVAGVPVVTDLLADIFAVVSSGDVLRVDADRGWVELLSNPETDLANRSAEGDTDHSESEDPARLAALRD